MHDAKRPGAEVRAQAEAAKRLYQGDAKALDALDAFLAKVR